MAKKETTKTKAKATPAVAPADTPEFDAIAEIKKLQAEMQRLSEENKKLEAVADVGRLSRYEAMNKEELVPVARLSFLDGERLVTAWRMVRDEAFVDARGVYHENQTVELTFEDGETQELPYLESVRRMQKRPGEIIARTKRSGQEEVTILLPDGREITIDIRFIN